MSEARRPEDRAGAGPAADGVYEWYRRGLALLADRHPAAAATVLARAAGAEPSSRSVLEALARAQYDAGRHGEAMASFRALVAADPADDYAHYGLGLAAGRVGDLEAAVEHLALASAMRPELVHYTRALRETRARQNRRTA